MLVGLENSKSVWLRNAFVGLWAGPIFVHEWRGEWYSWKWSANKYRAIRADHYFIKVREWANFLGMKFFSFHEIVCWTFLLFAKRKKTVKHRTCIVENTCSIFPMASLVRFFKLVLTVREFFGEIAHHKPPGPTEDNGPYQTLLSFTYSYPIPNFW